MIVDEEVYLNNLDYPLEDFFEHHGVRGMKWGVRRQRRIDLLKRASKKSGIPSGTAKARALLGYGPKLGPIDLVKGRGLSGGYRRKAVRMQARHKRIAQGKATTMDQLHRIGSFRLTDAIPVKAKNAKKTGSFKTDAAAVAAIGAVFVARQILQREVLKRQGM